MKSFTIALLLGLIVASIAAKSVSDGADYLDSPDTIDLSPEDDANALSKLSLATGAGKETESEVVGSNFDRPEVYDEFNSEVMPLDTEGQSETDAPEVDETSAAADDSTSSSETKEEAEAEESTTPKTDDSLASENVDESRTSLQQDESTDKPSDDKSDTAEQQTAGDEQQITSDANENSEEQKDDGKKDGSKQPTAVTKDDLLQALTTYRDNLQRMVGARGLLNSVNLDLVKFQQREDNYSVSTEVVINGIINAATTLRDFFDSYDTMLDSSELDELKEYISSSLNDAGYRYHSEVSKLYESGLNAITSQKRKAKQVERDASALQQQLTGGAEASGETTERMGQIKDVIKLEQQELKSLKASTKSLLNSLAAFKTKVDNATSIDKVKTLVEKSKKLVQTHVEYLQSIKSKFINAEDKNSKTLAGIVTDISSKATGVYTEAKGEYKKSKSSYKDVKHSLAKK